VHLDTFDAVKLGDVAVDTVMYTTTEYPFFASQEAVDNMWNNLAITSPAIIDGVRYVPSSRPLFLILVSGSVIVAQRWRAYSEVTEDYSHDNQIWWYAKTAHDIGATPQQLWTYPEVDTILNWDVYFPPVIDTTGIEP